METVQPHDDVATKKTTPTGRILLGVLVLLPALFGCVSQLLLPTVNTFVLSFQKIGSVGSERTYVGVDNYAQLFGNESFWRAAGFTFTTLLLRLFVVALVPLLLAWAAGQFGRPLRLGLRIFLTLPIVFFVPVAVAVTWLIFLNPATGLFPFERSWAASPGSARSTLLFIDALYMFGLASGLGLVIFLPLWRRSADVQPRAFREILKPMLATWVLGILGMIVLTLSTFTLNFVLTGGAPAGSTSTLAIWLYQSAFRNLNLGAAASVASLILLVTLVLGSLAGLLVIMTRLRLDVVDVKPVSGKASQPMTPRRSRILPGIVLTLLVLLILGTCLFSVLPFGWLIPQAFGSDGPRRLMEQVSAGQVFINSFVPPLITATLQMLIAYLAALGIGALRPLGKRSQWLLLLFSPWLFITVLPLTLVNFLAVQKADLLGTLRGSLSPILFSVPALFILAIFFSGRASQVPPETREGEARAAPNFFKHFILPSLPLAAVLWLVILFLSGQDVLWPLLVSISPERNTVSVTLLRLVGMFGGADAMLAAAVTFFVLPVCLFFFICLALFQFFYLDRLVLYSEVPSNERATQDLEQA